jgi:uncharacterized membrane protein YphA (DoxX/SURF4 family)
MLPVPVSRSGAVQGLPGLQGAGRERSEKMQGRGEVMESLVKVLQVVIGLGILNVWLVRFGKPTGWRGGHAKNMKEEFEVYGLAPWFLSVVGFLKILLAVLLILGVWLPAVTRYAAFGLAALMLGAVAMHVKVSDPVKKSLPALTVLVLCLIVALA